MYKFSSYSDLFNRYGSSQDHNEIRAFVYVSKASSLSTPKEVAREDKSTEETIDALLSLAELLKEHRGHLANRYNQLVTMSYKRTLSIVRTNSRYSGIKYTIHIFRTMEDNTVIYDLTEVYKGKERRAALARFEELKKQNPGIETVKDIEKSKWER